MTRDGEKQKTGGNNFCMEEERPLDFSTAFIAFEVN
jgi:hypothetical protein